MLRNTLQVRKERPHVFQALFLRNDKSQNVEVMEGKQIDFTMVQEHLENGGSIFITSKNSQKLKLEAPKKAKPFRNRDKKKTVTVFYFDHL